MHGATSSNHPTTFGLTDTRVYSISGPTASQLQPKNGFLPLLFCWVGFQIWILLSARKVQSSETQNLNFFIGSGSYCDRSLWDERNQSRNWLYWRSQGSRAFSPNIEAHARTPNTTKFKNHAGDFCPTNSAQKAQPRISGGKFTLAAKFDFVQKNVSGWGIGSALIWKMLWCVFCDQCVHRIVFFPSQVAHSAATVCLRSIEQISVTDESLELWCDDRLTKIRKVCQTQHCLCESASCSLRELWSQIAWLKGCNGTELVRSTAPLSFTPITNVSKIIANRRERVFERNQQQISHFGTRHPN